MKDDPVGQTSPATTGQPQDAVSVPTKLAGDDEEPSGKLDAKVADRTSDPEQATINTAGATEPVEPAGALAITTSSTPSPSTPSTITDQSSSVVELTVTPAATSALESLVDIAQREGHVNPLVAAATGAAAEVEAAPPAEYTGQPSFIHEVVVLVLRVVNAVLTPIGGILAFTGLKVPVFADGVPPFFVTTGLNVQRDSIAGMPVYILTPPAPTGATVIALHGGAYVAEASLFHWEMYADMARKTGATVIVPDYPLIGEPGGTAELVVPQTAELISQVIATRGAENTYMLGDSAGGGLALAAVQLLVASGAGAPTPRRMVLLAPWLDATVSDPASATVFDLRAS